jgi:hypothetical protein
MARHALGSVSQVHLAEACGERWGLTRGLLNVEEWTSFRSASRAETWSPQRLQDRTGQHLPVGFTATQCPSVRPRVPQGGKVQGALSVLEPSLICGHRGHTGHKATASLASGPGVLLCKDMAIARLLAGLEEDFWRSQSCPALPNSSSAMAVPGGRWEGQHLSFIPPAV